LKGKRGFHILPDGSLVESKKKKYKPHVYETKKKEPISHGKLALWIIGGFLVVFFWWILIIVKIFEHMIKRKR